MHEENELATTKDSLEYVRGTLLLLQQTQLFGPLMDKALEELDFVIRQPKEWRHR